MLYYPQLSSGAICQLPVSQTTGIRTISNELAGGDRITMADAGGGFVRWQLRYSDLADAEWASIEQLFEAAEGRLTTFTFLDPTDNLLMWSEDWTQSVWAADPLLQIGTGCQDPLGASNAMQVTNSSQTTQRITQSIGGASWYRYCFSVYLRSNVPSTVQLVASAGGRDLLTEVAAGPAWVRAVGSGILAIVQDGVAFGLQLPAGAAVNAFGGQVEAQGAAGQYKRTVNRSGVYARTRFDSDSLALTTNAPNQNAGTVQLYSNVAAT